MSYYVNNHGVYIGELKTDNVYKAILSIMRKRVLILDGAMGTQIQKYKLKNKHFAIRASANRTQTSNSDILNVTQPKLIEKIHADYIKSGSDIIETNTFSSNRVSQLDYNAQSQCSKLNKHGVLIAKRACLKLAFSANRRAFTAGSVGPTNKAASMSPNVLKPSYRAISFDELALAYEAQIDCMIANRVDIVIIETIFDTLNAKAAIYAYYNVCLKTRVKRPLMLSATISDNSGRTLSGQTVEAFWASVEHSNPLCVGLNCALGADKLRPYIASLASIASTAICAYPNAGLPNEFGEYNETPQQFASKINEYINDKLVNIVGGCCGSSPMHIAALKTLTMGIKPRAQADCKLALRLSGIDAITVKRNKFYRVGERANVTGSARFKQLILKREYNKALDILREQIANGADIVDINMDEALLNSESEMKEFINLISAEPDISRTPLMIDSSNWNTLLAGIKCTQGKCIVNSISLKDGERKFLARAQTIRMCGCVPIVIAFDELGQASSVRKRLRVCSRVRKLLKKAGYKQHETIFDLNTFAIATGLREHSNSAAELIKSIKLITALFPEANISIGVSNLSFSFRGNSAIRDSLHSAFLAHATAAGLNLGIVNVNSQIDVSSLNRGTRSLCEQLIFNTRSFSIDEILTEFGDQKSAKLTGKLNEAWRQWDLKSRLSHAVINGIEKFIASDSIQLLAVCAPISIIEGPLMEGMDVVGKLFGLGKMFLPQVVKSARVMKTAVCALTPFLKKTQAHIAHTILLATVKGDVHDIGKNILGIVLACNNYKIIDLGVMVGADEIVSTAISVNASAVGLSGLITPSLDEMINVASKLQQSGIKIPLLIGGATTTKTHTAVKIYPKYLNGITVHIANASKAVGVVSKLLAKTGQAFASSVRAEYSLIASAYSKSRLEQNKIEYNQVLTLKSKLKQKQTKQPNVIGSKLNVISNLEELINGINWKAHTLTWSASQTGALESESSVTQAKLANSTLALVKTVAAERWFSVRCNIKISKAIGAKQQLILLDKRSNPVDKLPMLSQQRRGSAYLSLDEFIDRDCDYISAFCCSVSYESALIHRFLKRLGRQQLANALKLVCDRIIEECSTCAFNNIRRHFWGFFDSFSQAADDGEKAGVRPAPGYPVCPDHCIKLKLTKLLASKQKTGLMVNSKHLITPQSSVIAFVLANKTASYFNIKNINADQVVAYAHAIKLPIQNIEKALSAIIGYIPSFIEQ
ncbi:MAG: methionine synthase [Candidatus Hodgkinia cicadicola]